MTHKQLFYFYDERVQKNSFIHCWYAGGFSVCMGLFNNGIGFRRECGGCSGRINCSININVKNNEKITSFIHGTIPIWVVVRSDDFQQTQRRVLHVRAFDRCRIGVTKPNALRFRHNRKSTLQLLSIELYKILRKLQKRLQPSIHAETGSKLSNKLNVFLVQCVQKQISGKLASFRSPFGLVLCGHFRKSRIAPDTHF